jgi:hypothetical protein
VLPEIRQLRTSDETGFEVAIKNAKIKDCSLEEIKQVLRLVIIKTGLRSQNWPTEEEKFVLIEHVIQNFGGHTCQEIKLAFDMAIAGKLHSRNNRGEVQTVNANCYENFSCLYFSTIMNAYRDWANEAFNQLPEKKHLSIEDKKDITDEEMLSWINEWKININLVSDPTLIPESFFPWLEKNNLLVLTKEQKIDYLTNQAVTYRHYQLCQQIKSEGEHSQFKLDLEHFNAMRQAECFTGIEINRLKDLAKKIAVFDYLKPEAKPVDEIINH